MPYKNLAVYWAVALLLAACGGGGGSSTMGFVEQPEEPVVTEPEEPIVEEPEGPVAQPVERLPFPFAEWTCDPSLAHIPGACGGDTSGSLTNHYAGISGLPAPATNDATHSPIVRDTDGNNRRLFVGVDQGTAHVGDLPVVGSRGDTEIRHGQLQDGAGRETVTAYLDDAVGTTVKRYSFSPEVRLIGAANDSDYQHLAVAVQLVNSALPADMRMTIGEPLPSLSLRDTVNAQGLWFPSGEERSNTIHVEFVPVGQFHSNAAATTWNDVDPETNEVGGSYVQFNKAANSYPRSVNDRVPSRQTLILLAHELSHALGVDAHVSPSFATIMEATARIHDAGQDGARQPMSLLYPVDREALQALYGRLQPGDAPTDLGPWSSTATHIHGNGEHAGTGWRCVTATQSLGPTAMYSLPIKPWRRASARALRSGPETSWA